MGCEFVVVGRRLIAGGYGELELKTQDDIWNFSVCVTWKWSGGTPPEP